MAFLMQLWFSRQSEISIRDQLTAQIRLAIVSGDLAPGQRLPSTRELARRFHLHPNTISAGYRQLEDQQWLEFRKGSGVYVAALRPPLSSDGLALDQLIAELFRSARRLNVPLSAVRSRLQHWLALQPPDRFLLIEPDTQLARILVNELQNQLSLTVESCCPQDYNPEDVVIPIATSFSLKSVRRFVPDSVEILPLQLRSAGDSLARHLPSSRTALLGIASGWLPFLKNARTMLVAAGFHPDCLVLRDTSQRCWKRGLKETAAVICDSLTEQILPEQPRVLKFRLLADSSLDELRRYEQFIRNPLAT